MDLGQEQIPQQKVLNAGDVSELRGRRGLGSARGL